MIFLRQSTAVVVPVGPFPDRTTALPLTALADQSANGRLVKGSTGAAFTAASWAYDAAGQYLVGLSTAHTDTVGRVRLSFSDPTTYLPVWEDFAVLSAAVYDVLFGTVAPSTHTAAAVQALVAAGTVTLAASQPSYAPSKAGDAMTLTTGERTAVATEVWADAPAGTPVADIAAEVWAEAPAGTPLSDIKSELVDALATDTYAESDGVPAATSTLAQKIGWLFKMSRNKTATTASGIAVRNDADSADSATTTHAESGGTYTRNKWSS